MSWQLLKLSADVCVSLIGHSAYEVYNEMRSPVRNFQGALSFEMKSRLRSGKLPSQFATFLKPQLFFSIIFYLIKLIVFNFRFPK